MNKNNEFFFLFCFFLSVTLLLLSPNSWIIMAFFRFLSLQDQLFLEYAVFMHKNGKSTIVPMCISIFLLSLIGNFKFIKVK